MKPYFETENGKIFHGDSLEVIPGLAEVDLAIADPPYNIGKAKWDKIPNYLAWCDQWIHEVSKICKQQGAIWCFHSEPLVLADIAKLIEKHGRRMLNWITWDKYNENGSHSKKGFLDGYTVIGGLRRFQDFAEYITYHADDGQWETQSDQCRGFIFEPLRAYLAGEWKRAGLKNEQANEACGTASMAARHYFARSQWCLPTAEHYISLQTFANRQGDDYLRREYEDLRREYEHLRPTFNNPGYVSSVWQFPPADSAGHPTTKPTALIKRIINSSTNLNDTVLCPFFGSGTTGVACEELGRKWIGIEISEKYCEIAARRIEKETQQLRLFV